MEGVEWYHLILSFFIGPVYLMGHYYGVFSWLIPYSTGMVIGNFALRRSGRAIGWLIFYIIGGSITGFLSGFFAYGDSEIMLWRIMSVIVMVGQTLFWGFLWFRYKKSGKYAGWRTVAATALIVSLAYTLPLMLYSYEVFAQHAEAKAWSERMDQNRAKKAQEFLEERESYWETVPAMVGFKEYPDTTWSNKVLLGNPNVEFLLPLRERIPGKDMMYFFCTKDLPDQVLEFYTECAEEADMEIRLGKYDGHFEDGSRWSYDLPALVATGDNNTAMIVTTSFMLNSWEVWIWWETNASFPNVILKHFGLE